MKYQLTTVSWDVLKEYVTKQPNKAYDCISPSALGGCMRAHYWKIHGVPATTPPNPGALVNFLVGHHWESVLADAYEAKGMLVKHFKDGEDKLYDKDTHLGGTPDLLVKIDNELVIVDSKTVGSAWFRYAKQQSLDTWVKDNMGYVYQQAAYIYLARKAGYDVNRAILSFASKDDGYIGREFSIEGSDDLIERVIGRAKTLKGYLDRNELPPCTCSGWKIGYCDYGNPKTQTQNYKKKVINSECCDPSYVIKGE